MKSPHPAAPPSSMRKWPSESNVNHRPNWLFVVMPTTSVSLEASKGRMDQDSAMLSVHTGMRESIPKKMESPMHRCNAAPSTRSPLSHEVGVGISTQKVEVSDADPHASFTDWSTTS